MYWTWIPHRLLLPLTVPVPIVVLTWMESMPPQLSSPVTSTKRIMRVLTYMESLLDRPSWLKTSTKRIKRCTEHHRLNLHNANYDFGKEIKQPVLQSYRKEAHHELGLKPILQRKRCHPYCLMRITTLKGDYVHLMQQNFLLRKRFDSCSNLHL